VTDYSSYVFKGQILHSTPQVQTNTFYVLSTLTSIVWATKDSKQRLYHSGIYNIVWYIQPILKIPKKATCCKPYMGISRKKCILWIKFIFSNSNKIKVTIHVWCTVWNYKTYLGMASILVFPWTSFLPLKEWNYTINQKYHRALKVMIIYFWKRKSRPRLAYWFISALDKGCFFFKGQMWKAPRDVERQMKSSSAVSPDQKEQIDLAS
jgi:hypothetical protein